MTEFKKFTFKTEKPTGSYRSFFPNLHYIKWNKKEVGDIDDKNPHTIRLKVYKSDINEDGNPNCLWKWIKFKKQFESVQDAKEWLNSPEILEAIQTKFRLKYI